MARTTTGEDLPAAVSTSAHADLLPMLPVPQLNESRESDFFKTCLRLRIKCLYWGPTRPDWMPSVQGKNQSSIVHPRKVVTETTLTERAKKLQQSIEGDNLNDPSQEKTTADVE